MKAKEYRKKIRELILEENLLLPDFQRDFVWKPQDQQLKLACSLFLDIPIGSILVLDKLENIGLRRLCYKKENGEPELKHSKLLMDGQQRVSTIKSIFSDLYSNNGSSDWKTINDCLHNNLRYRWFLNLSLKNLANDDLQQKLKLLYDFYWNKKFEDYDIEDIESFITSKKILIKNKKEERWHPYQEVDTVKNYCTEKHLLPLFMILSDLSKLISIIEEISEKYIGFLIEKERNMFVQEHIKTIKEKFGIIIENKIIENKERKSEIINKIKTNITQFFNDYIIYKEIYGVEYEKSQLNKAIVAFNTMNTGGISLGVFDIVSAKYSKLKKGRLSEKLLDHAKSFIKQIDDQFVAELIEEKFIKDDKNLITKNFSDMYLNMLSLSIKEKEYKTEGKFKLDWIKQQSLLKISANEIEDNSEKAVESLILAFQFLIKRCGVPSIKDIKYKLTIIPIAYNCYKNKEKEGIEDKIEYSYWMSLFSGKYEKGQNAFSIEYHLNNLIKFINDSGNNQFKKYEKDLCEKKGYSDFNGFSAFYEDNGYDYSSNIGEYFLQFLLASSVKSKMDIFKTDYQGTKKIKIEHFFKLNKDHIIPNDFFDDKKFKPKDSVLNLFYSPEKRNRKRSILPITEVVQEEALDVVLCCDKDQKYDQARWENKGDKLKKFLEERFNSFQTKVKTYLKDLEEQW